MERDPVEEIDQVRNPEEAVASDESSQDVGVGSRVKPPVSTGLTMIAGDMAGVCEGDACFVPSLVGKDDVG